MYMKQHDSRLPIRNQNIIKASDFILLVLQTQVKSSMRNREPGLASAYAELALLIQNAAEASRQGGAATLADKPEASAMVGGQR